MKKIKLGLDFDNTLINYDNVFYEVALKKGLINKNFEKSKLKIRDYLRSQGKDNEFSYMQGEVYGPAMHMAKESKNMINVLEKLQKKNINIIIVSHKTKKPYVGPPYDLRNYAIKWLETKGFFSANGLNWSKNQVYFESTKEKKIERILKEECTHYVDDLIEILEMIPKNISRIHFNNENTSKWKMGPFFSNWEELEDIL